MLKSLLAIIFTSASLVGCGSAQKQVGSPSEIPANSVRSQKPLSNQTQTSSLPSVESVKPTSVQIDRNENGRVEELNMTIRNEPTVRKLYSDLRTFPLFPQGKTMNCPLDTGVRYTLTFRHEDKVVLVAVADPTGCQWIKLSNGETVWTSGKVGKPFWTLIANSIGLPNENYLGGKP